jgi:hypothetical protein
MPILGATVQAGAVAGVSTSRGVYFAVIGALVAWAAVYLVYRIVMTRHRDFGMPVRRRLLCSHLRIHRDESAEVPIWWTDIQIARAVRAHWRDCLRLPFADARAQSQHLQVPYVAGGPRNSH